MHTFSSISVSGFGVTSFQAPSTNSTWLVTNALQISLTPYGKILIKNMHNTGCDDLYNNTRKTNTNREAQHDWNVIICQNKLTFSLWEGCWREKTKLELVKQLVVMYEMKCMAVTTTNRCIVLTL